MNNTMRTALPALLLLALLAAPLAGCEGMALPTSSPQDPPAGASVQTSPSQSPADPVASPEVTATLDPTVEPTPDPTPEPTPTATPTPDPTATPTATPEPTPTPTPVPTPVPKGPWNDGDRPDVKVIKYYTSALPEGLNISLLYKTYPAWFDYFVVLRSSAVRALPNAGSKALLGVRLMQRYQMLAQVRGSDGKSVWYRLRIPGKPGIGYIPAAAGSPRAFQIAKAFEKIKSLQQIANLPGTVRIQNYKNRLGKPPKIGGKEKDAFGYIRDQAAPAYLTPDSKSSFRYVPDGMLAQFLGTKGSFAQVYIPTFDEVRYIPTKYVYDYKHDLIASLAQVAVVDRRNQNITVFEYKQDQWNVVSFCYVSTGKTGGYSLPTPLGEFAAIEKKKPGKYNLGEFWYLADGVDPNAEDLKFSGYAPYAIRFSSGAYLHGLPKDVSYAKNPVTGKDEIVMPKSLTYESSTCLGTTPQSHMCVRNYTSHARFMWKWVKIGSAAVIVIE